jgi:endonuclease YncB( thermonuclease family)
MSAVRIRRLPSSAVAGVLVLLAFFFGAACQENGAGPDHPPAELRLKHIFDGDSFKAVGGGATFHIRIVGIDAPERGSRKAGVPGQPYSRKAAEYLKRLLSGRPIRVAGYGMDSYHRQLAEVFVGGRNVGLDMVASGFAEVYTGRMPKGFDPRPYRDAEVQARRDGRGMWAQGRAYLSPRAWRSAHPR